MKKKLERRTSDRKTVDSIEVADITLLDKYTIVARAAQIVDASTSGLLLRVERKDFLTKDLRENLTLTSLLGQAMAMYLPQMNLDLDGTVVRADHIGRGVFKIGIKFSADVPLYWRECLVDLMPSPGEFAKSAE